MKTASNFIDGSEKGQCNLPPLNLVKKYLSNMLDNQYYTESGPLLKICEQKLSQLLGVKNAICVSNPTIAWIMLLEAEGLANSRINVTNSVSKDILNAAIWLDCKIKLICKDNFEINSFNNDNFIKSNVQLILTNSFNGALDLHKALISKDIDIKKCLIDSSDSFFGYYKNSPLGSFGKAEVFSFSNKNIINGENCAVIATNCDYLSDYLRSMRGSGGVLNKVRVRRSLNGRMSEGQAAFLLSSLESSKEWLERNEELYEIYNSNLNNNNLIIKSNLQILRSNYQQFVFSFSDKNLENKFKNNLLKSELSVFHENNIQNDNNKNILENFFLPINSTVTVSNANKITNDILHLMRSL